MNPEIEVLDEDLKAYYLADERARYVPGVPVKIQLVRLLRKLLQQRGEQPGEAMDELHPPNITQRTAAALELTAAMLESLLPPGTDPRLIMLHGLVREMAPKPPPVLACPRCRMPRAEMEWHPADNRNQCPRCTASLLNPHQ